MSSRKHRAPASAANCVVGRALTAATPRAANDNAGHPANDALLRSALRLFADHGLGAAHRAQKHAEEAFFSGDRERYRWWLSVTRTLDRKLAVELCGRMGSENFGRQSKV